MFLLKKEAELFCRDFGCIKGMFSESIPSERVNLCVKRYRRAGRRSEAIIRVHGPRKCDYIFGDMALKSISSKSVRQARTVACCTTLPTLNYSSHSYEPHTALMTPLLFSYCAMASCMACDRWFTDLLILDTCVAVFCSSLSRDRAGGGPAATNDAIPFTLLCGEILLLLLLLISLSLSSVLLELQHNDIQPLQRVLNTLFFM